MLTFALTVVELLLIVERLIVVKPLATMTFAKTDTSRVRFRGGGNGPENNPARGFYGSYRPENFPTQSPSDWMAQTLPTQTGGNSQPNPTVSYTIVWTSTIVLPSSSAEVVPMPDSLLETISQTTVEISTHMSIYTSISSGQWTTVTDIATPTIIPSASATGRPQILNSGSGSGPNDRQTAIAAGIIGSLAGLVLAFLLVRYYIRRRRKSSNTGFFKHSNDHRHSPQEAMLRNNAQVSPFDDEYALPPSPTFIHRTPMAEYQHYQIGPARLERADEETRYGNTATSSLPANSRERPNTDNQTPRNHIVPRPEAVRTRDMGRVARRISGSIASMISIRALLPTYEESQSRIGLGSSGPATIQVPFSSSSSQDDLEMEYEAESARMGGFGAPNRERPGRLTQDSHEEIGKRE